MAALGGARRALLRCCSSSSPINRGLSSLPSPSPALPFARISRRKLPLNISRLPVELGCAQSLMPLHSVTASALLTSKLSLKSGNWGWLSEDLSRDK